MVHAPEFEFEKNINNVKEAVKRFGIKYPVIQDNDKGTWNAYQNQYWPRKYLVDNEGYIRYDHIGEGGYDETERVSRPSFRNVLLNLVSTLVSNKFQKFFIVTP